MAERGRKPGFVMSNEHRVKIQNIRRHCRIGKITPKDCIWDYLKCHVSILKSLNDEALARVRLHGNG